LKYRLVYEVSAEGIQEALRKVERGYGHLERIEVETAL
jgi:hypothetical protein